MDTLERGSRQPARHRDGRSPEACDAHGRSAENLQAALVTAEVVIKSLYSEVGWNVAVKWGSDSPKAAPVAPQPVLPIR